MTTRVWLIRRRASAGLVSALLMAGGGCGPGSGQSPGKPAGYIAVVGASADDPLWPVLKAASARFSLTTAKYDIRPAAPNALSANLQAELITALPRQDLRALCVQVVDPRTAKALLESLRARGVVVVTVMRRVESADAFLHSGIDQREVGAALADALAEQVPDRGTIATLLADNDPLYRLRRAGFQGRLARYPHLTVLRELDCRGDSALAVRLMGEVLERFPGIDGWVSMAAWPVQNHSDALTLPPGCRLVVPGPLPDLASHITFGRCHAVIVADYHRIATRALEMAATLLEGKTPAIRDFGAPLRRVTRQNLPEFERDWAGWIGQGTPASTIKDEG